MYVCTTGKGKEGRQDGRTEGRKEGENVQKLCDRILRVIKEGMFLCCRRIISQSDQTENYCLLQLPDTQFIPFGQQASP